MNYYILRYRDTTEIKTISFCNFQSALEYIELLNKNGFYGEFVLINKLRTSNNDKTKSLLDVNFFEE